MAKRGEGRSQVFAEIVGEEVTVCSTDKTGFGVTFRQQAYTGIKQSTELRETRPVMVHAEISKGGCKRERDACITCSMRKKFLHLATPTFSHTH